MKMKGLTLLSGCVFLACAINPPSHAGVKGNDLINDTAYANKSDLYIVDTYRSTSIDRLKSSMKYNQKEWVAFDKSQEPGAEVKVEINTRESNASRTVFELVIPGFWLSEKKGPDGEVYQQIEIPGMGTHNEIGAPDLPLYNFKLAAPLKGSKAFLSSEVLEREVFSGIRAWPQPIPEMDGEKETGTPERFQMDKGIYRTNAFWPGSFGQQDYKVGTALRNIPAINGQAYPVQYNPKTEELIVATRIQYVMEHDGERIEYEPMTQERYNLAKKYFINWELLGGIFKPNFKFYTSSFLVIYPSSDYEDEIKPFVDQKKARGFRVTEYNIDDDIGANTCDAIRDKIIDWEANVPWWHDAYTLLVGDTEEIPHCTSPTGDQTDDLYASTNGDDLTEEIYLGRLSIDGEIDLQNQLIKILAYQDSPSLFCCYDQAGLWAHKENAPGKYEGAHEAVRTFAYSKPPTFITYYGSQTGVSDLDIVDEVNGGVGVLAYRGHGNANATATGWNQSSEYFNGIEVSSLFNSLSQSPVVWGFACTNSKLDNEDSIAEKWMERDDAGSVSYYGATRTSFTSQNHVLDEWMFKAVYDEGLTTQSHAIARAEAQMAALSGSSNAWMYLLLGDPDMKIRTKNPISFTLKIPEIVKICKWCDITLQVLDEKGQPLNNALVGLWKSSKYANVNDKGETAVNAYTDKNGYVKLNYQALTEGEMLVSVEDAKGNSTLKTIQVSY